MQISLPIAFLVKEIFITHAHTPTTSAAMMKEGNYEFQVCILAGLWPDAAGRRRRRIIFSQLLDGAPRARSLHNNNNAVTSYEKQPLW
jgi:hypothetical protein